MPCKQTISIGRLYTARRLLPAEDGYSGGMSVDASTIISLTSDATKIEVAGSITEQSQLLVPETPGPQIRIDTAAVSRINSLGVANWIRYMAKLSEFGVPITIAPLSVAFVTQAGMISNFLGNASVETFLAPYFCPSCEHAMEQLFAVDAALPPSVPCPKCNGAMEFDDEIDSYLEFRR